MQNELLRVLKESRDHISGEELSRQLSVSRAMIWKCIEELRKKGYRIDAAPRRGYRLLAAPDKLFESEVQASLGTRKFGCHVYHYETLPSTMDEAFRLAMEGALEGTLVIAETQAKGRGRMGRLWVSPKGKGLYVSLILRPLAPPSDVARLTLLAAVALSEAVENVTGLKALIKWPNDLLINGKKVCGILTELRAEVDKTAFVVVGFGLNVNSSLSQLVAGASSLKEVKGAAVSRVSVLQEVLRVFERYYLALPKDGYGPVLAQWEQRSGTIGRVVHFAERGQKLSGQAVGLAQDGGLLIRLASGQIMKKMAGDIIL